MSKVLDGRIIAGQIYSELKEECLCLEAQGVIPKVMFIQGGDRPDSNQYVKNKKIKCKHIGIQPIHMKIAFENHTQYMADITEAVKLGNTICDGVVLQMPVPHINKSCQDMLVDLIDSSKDVDGLGCKSQAIFYVSKSNKYLPCTPAGIIEILKVSGIKIAGKNICVIGRSDIVGRPLALGLLNENATVSICHSQTNKADLAYNLSAADIIIAAVGKPEFINGNDFNLIDFSSKIIIDVGINKVDGQWFGDVSEEIKEKSFMHTPVPGGVGPMTISMLLKRVVNNAYVE